MRKSSKAARNKSELFPRPLPGAAGPEVRPTLLVRTDSQNLFQARRLRRSLECWNGKLEYTNALCLRHSAGPRTWCELTVSRAIKHTTDDRMGRTGKNDQRARSNLVMRVPLVPYPLASGRAEAAPAVLAVGIAAASPPAGRADTRRLGSQDCRDGADDARECASALALQLGSAKLSSAGLSAITINPSVT